MSESPTGARSKIGTVLRVTSGNFLEMFDFFLFGFYASYIAKAFFPTGSEFASLLLTFMTFGAGFLMRPLGAVVLGAYVDRHGRRKGLILTLGLMATGTITPETSQDFAAESERHGEYIKTVVLNSPGGSVSDALAMGRLIRAKRFATEVEPGKSCVSSCPLVFAGGVERRAGEKATIGVHQVAAMHSAANVPPRDEMSVGQTISARCQRYLGDMGVSLQVWVHAMETPHDSLFVFKPDELKSLNIVTSAAVSPPAAKTATAR